MATMAAHSLTLAEDDMPSTNPPLSQTQIRQPVEFSCWYCGTGSYHFKVCGLCQKAKYCGKECQSKDWKTHCASCQKTETVDISDYFKGGSCVEVNQELLEEESLEVVHLGLDKCPKNGHNNHADFIDIHQLSIDHLPKHLRRDDIMAYIRAEAALTVRLKVKFTSPNRPDSDACAQHRGTRFARTASGFYLLDNHDWFQKKLCEIPNCHRRRDLGEDHYVYEGDLKIFTNKHVIFDDEELAKTTVDFFYDSQDKKGMIQEYAIKLYYLNGISDKAFVKVTIHDEHMYQKLYDLDWERADRFRNIPKEVISNWGAYAILISHPHGMPKKVSIGKIYHHFLENETEETMRNAKTAGDLQKKWYATFLEQDHLEFMKYIGSMNLPVNKMWYDAATCPGSSGGPVLFGGTELEGVRGPYGANHNGYDLDSSLNFFKCIKFVH